MFTRPGSDLRVPIGIEPDRYDIVARMQASSDIIRETGVPSFMRAYEGPVDINVRNKKRSLELDEYAFLR